MSRVFDFVVHRGSLTRRALLATGSGLGFISLLHTEFWAYAKTLTADTLDASSPVKIEIMRKHSGTDCNSGYISVDGHIIAYTLERPTADNQPLFSAIPAGTYTAHLRYDHNDHWRVELENVRGRSNVQIHVGNSLDDTIGCVLIGKTLSDDFCGLGRSREAYAEFKSAVYGASNDGDVPPEIGVAVVISDP